MESFEGKDDENNVGRMARGLPPCFLCVLVLTGFNGGINSGFLNVHGCGIFQNKIQEWETTVSSR